MSIITGLSVDTVYRFPM